MSIPDAKKSVCRQALQARTWESVKGLLSLPLRIVKRDRKNNYFIWSSIPGNFSRIFTTRRVAIDENGNPQIKMQRIGDKEVPKKVYLAAFPLSEKKIELQNVLLSLLGSMNEIIASGKGTIMNVDGKIVEGNLPNNFQLGLIGFKDVCTSIREVFGGNFDVIYQRVMTLDALLADDSWLAQGGGFISALRDTEPADYFDRYLQQWSRLLNMASPDRLIKETGVIGGLQDPERIALRSFLVVNPSDLRLSDEQRGALSTICLRAFTTYIGEVKLIINLRDNTPIKDVNSKFKEDVENKKIPTFVYSYGFERALTTFGKKIKFANTKVNKRAKAQGRFKERTVGITEMTIKLN